MRGNVGQRYYGRKKLIDSETFKAIRARAGFNQEELAAKAGVSVKTVQRAEQDGPITKENAAAIAGALKLPIDQLFADAAVGIADEADLRSDLPTVRVLSAEGRQPAAEQDSCPTPLEESTALTLAEAEEAVFSTEMLYEYHGGRVSALRLYGRAEQCLAPQQIKVRYEDSNFLIPRALEVSGEERIRELTARRDRGEINFFDGPCARLLHWAEPSYESFAQDGRDHLELVLGPIGWYDVERTNGVLRNKLLKGERIDYEHWISLSALAQHGKVEVSKLANLLDNAITVFTNDGQVGYQDRGEGQSVGAKQLSSCVAENLHRYFDDTKPGDPLGVFHPLPPEMKLSDGPDNKECPSLQGELHPAAAVRRGITEETSYKMMDCVPDGGIKCTGLCFGLDALHPDLLWIVLVDLTAEQFIEKCRRESGRDRREGKIRFVPANFKDPETQRVLARPDWVAGGKASLVRAMELIDVLSYKLKVPQMKVFDVIKRHTSL